MIEFGQEVRGDTIALRYEWNIATLQWQMQMPVADRKSKMVVGGNWVDRPLNEIVAIGDDSRPPKNGEMRWARYQWMYLGVYIGRVYKQEGVYEYIDYDSGHILNHYGRKNVVLGAVAVRSSRGGFQIAYIPLD